ncbi:hypothetical protein KVV02_007730 [Mortierella alpina]|uniref:Uncharacterized protein n=1 Tax=Mortierella alpina TaxID=64518 RepID=A0A9P8A0G5_MORAP|nr:hypothetical protein KVV02_007730 [Mortierella alpina]
MCSMGIRDLYKVLAQKNLKPPEADLHQLPPNCVIDIDFMGTSSLWSLTRRLMTEDYNLTTARTAGMKLASHIRNLFCDDGPSEHGTYSCKTTLDKIKKTLATLFVLTQADKDILCGAMASFNPDKVTVCRCATEADLCNAISLSRELVPGRRVVVSGDSDLLAYLPTERVLRSIPNTASFSWYTKDEVEEKMLRLPSHQHLLLLAIVAANDYGGNVKTLGIITNCDIIRDLPAGNIDEMLEGFALLHLKGLDPSIPEGCRPQLCQRACSPPSKKSQSGPKPRKRQPARKKKQQKHRAKGEDVDQPYKRQLQSSTKHDHGLMKKHVTKALAIGCINNAVHQTLLPKQVSAISKVDAESEVRRKAKVIATKLRSTALMMNQLQTYAYEIIALDIATILNSSESTFITILVLFYSTEVLDQPRSTKGVKPAPARTVSTRRTSAAVQTPQEEIPVPHTVKAFELYSAKPGSYRSICVQSLASDQGQSPSSVQASRLGPAQKYNANAVRLSLLSVKSAIRGHYIGSKFPDHPDREDSTNAIVYFFEHNRQAQEFRDFPKAKWAPGFVVLSESEFTYCGSVKTVGQAEKLVVASKGVLIQILFFSTNSDQRLNGYSGKVSLQKDTSRQTKLKLRGTICTNGLQLLLLAHDTSTTRRRREKVQDDNDNDDDDDLFGAAQNIEADVQLDDAFIADADEEPEVELGPSTSSKKRTYSDISPSSSPPREQAKEADLYDTINWTRGSRLLVNVAKKIRFTQGQCRVPSPEHSHYRHGTRGAQHHDCDSDRPSEKQRTDLTHHPAVIFISTIRNPDIFLN